MTVVVQSIENGIVTICMNFIKVYILFVYAVYVAFLQYV
jgi:hypothetical protein